MKTRDKLTGYGECVGGWICVLLGVLFVFAIVFGLAGMLP